MKKRLVLLLCSKKSRFESVGAGVFSNFAGSSNFYVADNWFYGRNDPNHLMGWAGPQLWGRFNGVDGQTFPPKMASYWDCSTVRSRKAADRSAHRVCPRSLARTCS